MRGASAATLVLKLGKDSTLDLALDSALARVAPDEIVCTRFGAPMTRRILACLLPDRWLNDEVINCYLRLIQERSGNRCWCPGSFFWLKLEKEGHAGVQRWARRAKVDVSSLQAILLAIHREGTHWGLGVLDLQGRALRYFDSLGIAPPLSLAARLNEYLEGEIHAWRWGFDFSPLPMLHDKEAPRQQNGSDCGVLLCKYAERFMAEAPVRFDTCPKATERIRLAIASAILRGRLGYHE